MSDKTICDFFFGFHGKNKDEVSISTTLSSSNVLNESRWTFHLFDGSTIRRFRSLRL